MRQPAGALRRLLWLLCAFVLLPGVTAAQSSLAVDLDGDDRHDRVTVDRRDPSVLGIWLSDSNTTQLIRTDVPLRNVVAADLDGDHKLALVARDSRSRIRVWTRTHLKFRAFRARPSVDGRLTTPNRRGVDEHDREVTGVAATDDLAPCAPMPRASKPVPVLERFHTRPLRTARACRSLPAIDPFTPRPPPPPFSI